ncbi:MAG: bifunctional phosphopantothenoylcysteine decarboxylase/phosphopantothenate--cysteine ligase CoaBC [Burkholderiales bacterium]|nr:bifunctional phosphopantothenoylcysteine decarboxylase/phosphopantothenate--cysteine ligase CoaBC [Burkholderiales bacterium]MDQ3196558.1 bifunctional phosphopantothenoylcysteine decarboxylase/phosphopantothenate--cysteine ligase CoaBC [Pseudomonadota bacterium]
MGASRHRLLLGVTGGVAAYKAAELARLLQQTAIDVQVVMTASAQRFVAPLTFQSLTGNPVMTDMWNGTGSGMPHIDLSRDCDGIIIAPASADFIAKLVTGLADDLLSTLCLARECPLMIAPAMNRQMWENAATQRNMRQLEAEGVAIAGPAAGAQACGETGFGRLLEAPELAAAIEAWLQPKLLRDVRVLMTAGPTFEAIDAVRGITNLSSGKMGYAIAQAAIAAGADVTLVSGPTCLAAPARARLINATSAAEMLAAVIAEVSSCAIFIGVAAVADYSVATPNLQKIKKTKDTLTLELARNPDILDYVANLPQPPFCVGFAAESENLVEYAQEKRRRKRLPLLAANLVQDALGRDDSELILFDDEGAHSLPRAAKSVLAGQLIAHVAKLYRKPALAEKRKAP